MADGQEYAVVLPHSNAGALFAQSFMQSKDRADTQRMYKQKAEHDAQRDAMKDARDQANDAWKFYANAFEKITPEQLAQKEVNRYVADGKAALQKAIAEGKTDMGTLLYTRDQYMGKAIDIIGKKAVLKETVAALEPAYSGMKGVDPKNINRIISAEIEQKGFDGVDLSQAGIAKLIEQNEHKLVNSDEGLITYFKNIGSHQEAERSGSNLSNSSRSYTVAEDAVLVGDKILPKSEKLVIESGMPSNFGGGGKLGDFRRDAKQREITHQNFLAQTLGDTDGTIDLYDADQFKRLMEDKSAALYVKKKATEYIDAFEKTTGKKFPRGTEYETDLMRAIAYEERKHSMDTKYSEGNRTYISVNGGGGSGDGDGGGKSMNAFTRSANDILKHNNASQLYSNAATEEIELPGKGKISVLDVTYRFGDNLLIGRQKGFDPITQKPLPKYGKVYIEKGKPNVIYIQDGNDIKKLSGVEAANYMARLADINVSGGEANFNKFVKPGEVDNTSDEIEAYETKAKATTLFNKVKQFFLPQN